MRGRHSHGGRRPMSGRKFSCRVCMRVFDTRRDLNDHLRAENHYTSYSHTPTSHTPTSHTSYSHTSTSLTPTSHTSSSSSIYPSQAYKPPHTHTSSSSKDTTSHTSSSSSIYPSQAYKPPHTHTSSSSKDTTSHTSTSLTPTSHTSSSSSIYPSQAYKPPHTHTSSSSKDTTSHTSSSHTSSSSSIYPSHAYKPPHTHTSSSSKDTTSSSLSTNSTSQPIELHHDGQIIGRCMYMCPREEILKRIKENDIHIFEQPYDFNERIEKGTILDDNFMNCLQQTMIKQLQKSSADHTLSIPHLVRTPSALLRTIEYIERNIMSLEYQLEDIYEDYSYNHLALDVYHFVWNRYRMIAKDFILQNYRFGGRLDRDCVECHERMTRWHIMMDHQMLWSENFVTHDAHQHQEQLNKLLKTLNELYDEADNHRQTNQDRISPPNEDVDVPNEAEFRSYYILHQLDNEGEVEKYLQTIKEDIFYHPHIQFALKVVRAWKQKNYATYFRLLRTCNFLHACALYKYVSVVRMEALKIISRALRPGKQEIKFPLSDLVHILDFEDTEDAMLFSTQCGLEVVMPSDNDCGASVLLSSKMNCSVIPKSNKVRRDIVERMGQMSRAEVSRGLASGAVKSNVEPQKTTQCSVSNCDLSEHVPSTGGMASSETSKCERGTVAESLLLMRKNGRNLSRYSKPLK